MVLITPFLGATALLSGMASALPRPNGVAVASQPPTSSSVVADSSNSVSNGMSVASQSTMASAVATYTSSNGYGSAAPYGSSSHSSYGSYGDASFSSDSALATSTYSATSSYSTPVYGSGSSNWGGSGYDDCVSQCIAQFGTPDSTYMPTSTSQSEGSTGTGATHTVIVAPSQGVLRYVPFAVNASVGDTIKFMWGANNHTVTKSSELTPCNKTSDAPFISGTQNKDFVFTQVVNDTNPVFFYCGTPTHCQQGMFGIINPPSAFGSASSVSVSMQSISANNSDVAAYASYTSQKTANNLAASKWGGNIDLSSLPDWAHAFAAENVLYTRNFLASNPEVLKEDGTIDLSSGPSTPLMIPQDFSAAINSAAPNNAASGSVSGPSTETSATASSATAAPTTSMTVSGNGASSSASPRALVALFAVVATFLAF